jgi:CHAD domain-containing protein
LQSKSQDISQSIPTSQRRVNPQLAHLGQLTAKLKENLGLCAEQKPGESKDPAPGVDAVHDTRTGTRRIEAVLDSILDSILNSIDRNPAGRSAASRSALAAHEALVDAIERWQKLLKKIRRSAGAVRDLDVHRHLLRDLLKDLAKGSAPKPLDASHAESPDGTPEPNPARSAESTIGRGSSPGEATVSGLQKQAEDLDAWLRHTREEHAQPLVDGAKKWAAKLDAHLAALAEALQVQPASRRKPASAAVTALEAFAKLSSEMQQLYAENLHDFRKGAKKARYMAETGGNDEYAGAVGKALKKLQDEIGDWHDWLVLAEEAHRALGDQGAELIARIEHERERHYKSAMKTAERMRGRLMGEWHASAARPRRAASPKRS